MESCSFCLKADIADKAIRCHHCGSWLEPGHDADEADRLRHELRIDHDAHRAMIEKMLSRLQNVAAVIIVAAASAALFFGFRTDESITSTSQRISDEARVQIEAAATKITNQASGEVRRVVVGKLASTEMSNKIDLEIKKSLTGTVESAVKERFEPFSHEVNQLAEKSRLELDNLTTNIKELRERSENAMQEVKAIQTGFSEAQNQTVQTSRTLLPAELIHFNPEHFSIVGKGGWPSSRSL